MAFAAKIKPALTPRPYPLDFIMIGATAPVVLHATYAGFSNKPLTNAQFKQANIKRARNVAGVNTAEQTVATLREDAQQLADFVVKGWDNVCEEDGSLTPPTKENFRRFLSWLLDEERLDIFLAFRAWASNADNFVETFGDPAELGK